MTADLEAWTTLAQGGRLLDRRALETLPVPPHAPPLLADDLRDALVTAPDLGTLLDLVLDSACGLNTGWLKGPEVGTAFAEKLLDGTTLKPRRVLMADEQPALSVFVTTADRIGQHKGKRAVAQTVEYLRRRRTPLGILTNGREWRFIFADADNLAWVEWAADRWLEGDNLTPAFALLRRVLSTLAKDGGAALLNAIRQTRRGQAQLSKELGERVRSAVELLLRARRPVLEATWNDAEAKATYDAACHFVMRLVVVLFAEARELLPVDNAVYHQGYGLRGLMESLERAGVDRRRARHSAWWRVRALFNLLHKGSEHPALSVPQYGGALFQEGDPNGDAIARALFKLEALEHTPDDEVIYRMLDLLTRTKHEGHTTPVDFTELTSEYIGILYEGLLDYELHRAGNEPIVFLNLGDQPALPLDRLEAMEDKQLAALVEKSKMKRAAEDSADEESDEEDTDSDEESSDEEPDERPAATEVLTLDDDHREAHQRAVAWGERAAIAAKRVKAKPRKEKDVPAWQADLTKKAEALIADVKVPGELYLVRWGGTRKGAGTFYTRPQLTLPTVRRTLEPLLHDESGRIRKPEELLALKVCDPAMGSGSFLVAALRVMTEAVHRSLHEHDRIKRNGDLARIECELLPEADRDQSEERVEAIVRRAVVEHCLYGVDRDQLAVELARVALWVETLDRRLPFTFLDHKLRCGDALIGTWLDRFRDYPLLAWWRQSPDEKYRGVTHEGDLWANALKERRKAMVAEQAELLSGQRSWLASSLSDDELKADIERVRELYKRLRKVPATQPDKRAEIWRTKVAPDPALMRVREAFDLWCALWFWPLDRLDDAPGPAELAAPSPTAREIARGLQKDKRFFHWELEFPDVFTMQGSGFDAIVANPPWETKKPNSKEFFSDRDPLYRSYGKQEALSWQREEFNRDGAFERRWLDYVAGFKDAGNFVRNAAEPFGDADDVQGKQAVALVQRKPDDNRSTHKRWADQRAERNRKTGLADAEHPFRHQGSADLNSYKLFIEQAHSLLRPQGIFGVVVPSGLYTDKGSQALRRLLLDRCDLQLLYSFQNEKKFFREVDHRFKQCLLIVRKGARTEAVGVMFRLGPGDSPEPEEIASDLGSAWRPVSYSRALIEKLSPVSTSMLEIRSNRDLEVLTRIYEASIPLGADGPDGWGLKYATEFHMTNDSKLFVAREKAEAAGYRPDIYGRWVGPDKDVLLPLYQGAMVHQHDFSFKGWAISADGAREWVLNSRSEKAWAPKFLLPETDYRSSSRAVFGPKLAFRDIARSTDERTSIAAILPDMPCGNVLGILECSESDAIALAAVMSAFAFDFTTRIRVSGTHMNFYVVAELPLPATRHQGVASTVMRLGLTTARFAPTWLSKGGGDAAKSWQRKWALTPHERLRLRSILDAIIAALYGLTRDDLRWILRDCDHPKARLSDKSFCRTLDPKGFWRVDKTDHPELRHTALTQVAFDALSALITEHEGDRDKGIAAFSALNNGEGWLIPETLRLADHGLGHDERGKEAQPVASVLGPRFLDWQLKQTPEESWAECEKHARAILGDEAFERRFGGGKPAPSPKRTKTADTPAKDRQPDLFDQVSTRQLKLDDP